MGRLAFLIVLLLLVLIPPHSRVVDPPLCIGMCLDGAAPDEIIVPNSASGS